MRKRIGPYHTYESFNRLSEFQLSLEPRWHLRPQSIRDSVTKPYQDDLERARLDYIFWISTSWSSAEDELQGIRLDRIGARIKRSEHGTEGPLSWEIDHIVPKADGGSEDTANLQAMYWRTNRSKGDRPYPLTRYVHDSLSGSNVPDYFIRSRFWTRL